MLFGLFWTVRSSCRRAANSRARTHHTAQKWSHLGSLSKHSTDINMTSFWQYLRLFYEEYLLCCPETHKQGLWKLSFFFSQPTTEFSIIKIYGKNKNSIKERFCHCGRLLSHTLKNNFSKQRFPKHQLSFSSTCFHLEILHCQKQDLPALQSVLLEHMDAAGTKDVLSTNAI